MKPLSPILPAKLWSLGTIFLICVLAPNVRAQTNPYAIPWFKIAGGGGMQSTGGVYALSGTIGQIDTGRTSASNAFS